MYKRYWKGHLRNKGICWIDYQIENKNTCEIYSSLTWKKIDNYLLTLESKRLITNDNIELIYTWLIYLSNTKTGITYWKHFNTFSKIQEYYFRYDN